MGDPTRFTHLAAGFNTFLIIGRKEPRLFHLCPSEPVYAYLEARSARIRRIMRLDPLGLRNLLPRRAVEWLFARFALLVRRRTRVRGGAPDVTWRDFPIGPANERCLDLLALCRRPV